MATLNDQLLINRAHCFKIPPKKVRKLCLRGGGAKGAVYPGALRALHEKGVLEAIDTVGGSSAGALTAVMVAIGMSPAKIQEEVNKTDFNKFKDYSPAISGRGLCTGKLLEQHIQDSIEEYLEPQIKHAKYAKREAICLNLKELIKDANGHKEQLQQYFDKLNILRDEEKFHEKFKSSLVGEEQSQKDKPSLKGDASQLYQEVLAEFNFNVSVDKVKPLIESHRANIFNKTAIELQKYLQKYREEISTTLLIQPNENEPKNPLVKHTIELEKLHEIKTREVTFEQLKLLNSCLGNSVKRLIITGSNITKKCLDIFSDEKTPNMPIWLAARISASFPIVFQSVWYEGCEYIDGGVGDNLPVRHFLKEQKDNPSMLSLKEKIEETLSFQFQQPPTSINTGLLTTIINFLKYVASGFIDVVANSEELMDALTHDFRDNVIALPVDIATLDFDLTPEKKKSLHKNAYEAVNTSDLLKKITEVKGDILECFLSMPLESLEKYDFRKELEDPDNRIRELQEKILDHKRSMSDKLIKIQNRFIFINKNIDAGISIDLQENFDILADAINNFVPSQIEFNDGNVLSLEDRHKAILYKKIQDTLPSSKEFGRIIGKKTQEILSLLEKYERVKNKKNISSEKKQEHEKMIEDQLVIAKLFQSKHGDLFVNLCLSHIKDEAIKQFIPTKVKAFQLRSNVVLLDEAMDKIRNAGSTEEIKQAFEKIRLNYYSRNLFSVLPGASQFFKGHPGASTVNLVDKFIKKIDAIESLLEVSIDEQALVDEHPDTPQDLNNQGFSG